VAAVEVVEIALVAAEAIPAVVPVEADAATIRAGEHCLPLSRQSIGKF